MPSSEAALRALRVAVLAAGIALPACVVAQQVDAQQTAQALARAQGLLRQIGQQKQQLELDNAKLQAELASLEKRLRKSALDVDDATAELASREREGKQVAHTLERTQARLDQTTAKLQEVVGRYKDTARTLGQTTAEKEQLEAELATRKRELADAEARNLALYRANREILDLYRNKSGWAAFLQNEPVTGIKGVAVEDLIEKYQYEMYDQLLESNLDAAAE